MRPWCDVRSSVEGNVVVGKLVDGKQFKANISNSQMTITIKRQKAIAAR